MFQQLNVEGITVLLVTHDPKVAAYAHRVVRIVDGRIDSDESAPSDVKPDLADIPHEKPAAESTGKPASLFDGASAKPRSFGLPTLVPPTFRSALGACGATSCARRSRPWA